jgi:hypothetical protein
LVGCGPASAEIVVSIFPLPVSAKRGGACFKAADGIGRIQLKCNNPINTELSVCITIGSNATRCQKHNFVSNPLMTFLGEWDFKKFIDKHADRPTVAVSLQLLSTDGVVEPSGLDESSIASTTLAPAIADPAIAAFSFSTSPSAVPMTEHPEVSLENDKATAQVDGYAKEAPPAGFQKPPTGSQMPSLSTPQQTPEVTPRTTSSEICQSTWSTPQAPPSSPFFNYGGSLCFTFTLRRADNVKMGLDVDKEESDQELVVTRVIPGGAIEAWNRQCFAGPFSSKALVPGDRVVGINQRSDIPGMLEECRSNQLLKLYVVRGDLLHVDIPLGWCGASTPSPTIQLVPIPVPIIFTVPCVKHGSVDALMVAGPDQLGGDAASFCTEVPTSVTLRASAPEFFPPGSSGMGQDADADVTVGVDGTSE